MWLASVPRWAVIIMYIDYLVVIRIFRPIRMREKLENQQALKFYRHIQT